MSVSNLGDVKFLKVAEVASLMRVSKMSVYRLSHNGELEAVLGAIRGFRPLRHRMEEVTTIEGVRYIDDSKATNPHATIAAVSGLSDVVLIAGGRAPPARRAYRSSKRTGMVSTSSTGIPGSSPPMASATAQIPATRS